MGLWLLKDAFSTASGDARLPPRTIADRYQTHTPTGRGIIPTRLLTHRPLSSFPDVFRTRRKSPEKLQQIWHKWQHTPPLNSNTPPRRPPTPPPGLRTPRDPGPAPSGVRRGPPPISRVPPGYPRGRGPGTREMPSKPRQKRPPFDPPPRGGQKRSILPEFSRLKPKPDPPFFGHYHR